MILSVEECWDAFFFFFFHVFSCFQNIQIEDNTPLKKRTKHSSIKKDFPVPPSASTNHNACEEAADVWGLRTGPVEIPPIWNLGWSLSRSIWAKGMWGLANSSTFLFFSLKGFLAALLWHTLLCRIQSKCSCLKPNICNILYIRSMCMWTFWLLSPNNTSLVIAVHTKSTLT